MLFYFIFNKDVCNEYTDKLENVRTVLGFLTSNLCLVVKDKFYYYGLKEKCK